MFRIASALCFVLGIAAAVMCGYSWQTSGVTNAVPVLGFWSYSAALAGLIVKELAP